MSDRATHGSKSQGVAEYRLIRMPRYPGVASTIEAGLV